MSHASVLVTDVLGSAFLSLMSWAVQEGKKPLEVMFPMLIPSWVRQYSSPLPGLPVIINLWISVLQLRIKTFRINNLWSSIQLKSPLFSDSFHRLLWVSELCKGFFENIHYRACVLSRAVMTPWTVAHQTPLSMGFSRQEYWRGLPCPTPEDLPGPGIKARSPTLQADCLPIQPLGKSSYLGYIHLSEI